MYVSNLHSTAGFFYILYVNVHLCIDKLFFHFLWKISKGTWENDINYSAFVLPQLNQSSESIYFEHCQSKQMTIKLFASLATP